jgi:hypothetical protein
MAVDLLRPFRRRAQSVPEPAAMLGLPVDTGSLDFKRGVEFGILFARTKDFRHVDAAVHADMAELIMRLADGRGLSFSAQPHQHDENCSESIGWSDCKDGGDWLDVTISSAPL